jgi:hypothetical protein
MREAFGDTLSEEFVEVLLGKLIDAKRAGGQADLAEQRLGDPP